MHAGATHEHNPYAPSQVPDVSLTPEPKQEDWPLVRPAAKDGTAWWIRFGQHDAPLSGPALWGAIAFLTDLQARAPPRAPATNRRHAVGC